LSVAAAGTAFSLINGSHVDWLGTLLAASVAVAVDAAINFGESALTTSLASSVGVISVLQRMRFGSMRWFLFAYWSFGLIGLLVAEIYLSVGILGTVLLVGPILITREAFKKREEAERADESLQVSAEALKRVDERIAEERRDERARLAEALHDDVLQRLFDASIRAEVIRQAYLGGRLLELEEDVPSLVESINGAAGHLRQVIAGLRTSSVGHAGLVGTLELLAAHLQDEHGVRTVLSADASIRMSPESELLVYQIAREAMTNAMRHSRAAAVWVTLRRQDDWLVLVVEDDGQGFDCLAQGDLRHFGLQLMRERAAALGGRLSIRSSEGSGTVVELLFKDSH
jgi:signal transduction histidine kinase